MRSMQPSLALLAVVLLGWLSDVGKTHLLHHVRPAIASTTYKYYQDPSLLGLVRNRYPHCDDGTLGQVTRYLLHNGPSRDQCNDLGIPGVTIGHPVPARYRSSYLRKCIPRLQSVFFDSFYTNSLGRYLQTRGVSRPRHLNHYLALNDIAFARNHIAPRSPQDFNNFFGSRFLNFNGNAPNGFNFPSTSYLVDNFNTVPLTNTLPGFIQPTIFSPFNSFSRLPLGPLNNARNTRYDQLLRYFPTLSLPIPTNPGVTLNGYISYLSSANIQLDSYLSSIRDVRIPYSTYLTGINFKPINQRWHSFLTQRLIQRDVLPLLSLRYYGLPRNMCRRIPFSDVFSDYLLTWDYRRKNYDVNFVVSILTGFDSYLKNLLNGGYSPRKPFYNQLPGLSSWNQWRTYSWWNNRQDSCRGRYSGSCLWRSSYFGGKHYNRGPRYYKHNLLGRFG